MQLLREFKSLYRFARAKGNYYRGLDPLPPSDNPFVAQAIKGLQQEGVAVFPGWMPRPEALNLHAIVRGDLEKLRKGEDQLEGKKWFFPTDGVYRVLEADLRYPPTRRFFDDPRIETVAKTYVCRNIKSYQRMSEIRPDPGASCSSDRAHFDDWKYRFKAFLYLTDVTEENAPFSYWKGSHRMARIRLKMEYLYFRDGKKGSYGCYSDEQISTIERKHRIKREAITGLAGTLILADTRGLHAGTPLSQNGDPRVLLANYFDT